MFEVYRDREASKVGRINDILEQQGIKTTLRNWHPDSMMNQIPLPYMFPFIMVFSEEDSIKAKAIIREYENGDPVDLGEWNCPQCGERIEGTLTECWSCQTERKIDL